jgi:hypothetical protein
MDRYSFPVRLLHSQLSAGLSRRTDFIPFEVPRRLRLKP